MYKYVTMYMYVCACVCMRMCICVCIYVCVSAAYFVSEKRNSSSARSSRSSTNFSALLLPR